jgi:hypothetical protein
MVDEVDKATGYDVVSAFLGLLRDMYLEQSDRGTPAFHSVVVFPYCRARLIVKYSPGSM